MSLNDEWKDVAQQPDNADWSDQAREARAAEEAARGEVSTRSTAGSDFALLTGVGLLFLVAFGLFLRMRQSLPAVTSEAPPAMVQQPAAPAPVAVPSALAWDYSFESAQQRAQSASMPMMIDFYTDWCGVCKGMDLETYSNAEVIGESANYINVKINAETRTDLAQRYGVKSYPTIIWADSAGNERGRVSGGYPPASFLPFMRQHKARS
ncbi:MAG TPA: thioredoxin family protein [Abditibacteriaceae bacterium]|jgi:thiol:disulfide interchange protein